MQKGKLALAVGVCLTVAGCVMPTKQPMPNEVRPVPGERVFGVPPQSSPLGKVNVTRDVGHIGGACFLGVMVDGKLVAHIDRAERLSMDLGAGRHVLTATWVKGRGLCGAFYNEETAIARRRSTEILVDPSQSRDYRVHTNSDGEVSIEPAF